MEGNAEMQELPSLYPLKFAATNSVSQNFEDTASVDISMETPILSAERANFTWLRDTRVTKYCRHELGCCLK